MAESSHRLETPRTPPNAATPPRVFGHPQHIAPSFARQIDARLIAPFVREKRMMELDKGMQIGGKIPCEVLHHVLQNHVNPCMRKARMTFPSAEDGELSARPVLSHLFPIFWGMVPRGAGADDDDDDDHQDLAVDTSTTVQLPEAPGASTGSQTPGQVGSQTPGVAWQSQDSVMDLEARHEDRTDRGALDFCFRSKLLAGKQEWVWRLLLDAKDSKISKTDHWSDVVVWQLLSYANYYAMHNSRSRKCGILHLAAMQIGFFAYAQLHVYGMIEVKGGMISDQAFQLYKTQESSTLLDIMRKSEDKGFVNGMERSKEDLEQDLQTVSDDIAEKKVGARLLDGWYIVGDLYIENKPVRWDTFSESLPELVPNSMYVTEYFLETLVGRKVRKWTPQVVDEMVAENEMLLNKENDQYYEINRHLHFQKYEEMVRKRQESDSRSRRPGLRERDTRKKMRLFPN